MTTTPAGQTPCRADREWWDSMRRRRGALTGDDQRDGDLRLSELVAHEHSVVAGVLDVGVEDRQRAVVRLTELCTQLRPESLALLDQNALPIPRDLQQQTTPLPTRTLKGYSINLFNFNYFR